MIPNSMATNVLPKVAVRGSLAPLPTLVALDLRTRSLLAFESAELSVAVLGLEIAQL